MNNHTESLQVAQEFIDPETAYVYLGRNLHNRNLREQRVLGIARDIVNNQWRETGEAIKFAADGTLLDGQHRLAAITVANKGITTLVVRGLDNGAQEMMDTGAKRSLSDLLKLRGEAYTTNLAALLRLVHAWKQGERGAMPTYTNAELLTTLSEHPEVREILPKAGRVGSAIHTPPTFIGLMWWVFEQIDPIDADDFFQRLGSDVGHSDTSPVTLLRRRLLSGDARPALYGGRRLAMALTIKAWNAYREDAPMRSLGYRPGGARPESFPVPR